jgi:IS5 family transposase
MMRNKARGLFDEQFRLDKITKQNDPLQRLQKHIDFEMFRKPLTDHFQKGKDGKQGGRPAFDYLMMFKILILQRYYNLSDDHTEFAILDRLSFMRFLGLTISDTVPDAKTIWNFRNELTKAQLVEKLFGLLDRKLNKEGVLVHKGKMIDASIAEVPIQRNSREENGQLKGGEIPEEWKENPNKLRQKDTDAKWVRKGNQDFFGYKNHIKADTKTKLITGYLVTSANIPDKDVLFDLLTKKDQHQKLHADSAYRSEFIEEVLKRRKIKSLVHEKGYRHKKITARQAARNRKKSQVRARVEHVFGFMTNSMNRMYYRCRSYVRIKATLGLVNITYNLFRITQLKGTIRLA